MSELRDEVKFFLEPIKAEVTSVLSVEHYAEIVFGKVMIFCVKEGYEHEDSNQLAALLSEAFPDNYVVLLPHFVDIVRLWPITDEALEVVKRNAT